MLCQSTFVKVIALIYKLILKLKDWNTQSYNFICIFTYNMKEIVPVSESSYQRTLANRLYFLYGMFLLVYVLFSEEV
jgi:hypothetical protein